MRHISLRGTAVFILLLAHMAAAGTPNRVTILYDSFGKSPTLTMDWGFAALVDYGGKRILFDTGNNAQIFEHNVKAAGVDLQKLDFVVMSHRHGDHMGGLAYLLKVNPTVKIYAEGEVRSLRRRPAQQYVVSQGPVSAHGTAVLPRRAARNHTHGRGLAQRQLSADRQEHRDCARHVSDCAGIRHTRYAGSA